MLLRPLVHPSRPVVDPSDILIGAGAGFVASELASLPSADAVVVDLETKGVDPAHSESAIVGVGLAWRSGTETQSKYFDYQSMDEEARFVLWEFLGYCSGLITAYNLIFDGAWTAREIQRLNKLGNPSGKQYALLTDLKWTHCAYALQRQLATEDFAGQMWGLKFAQVDLLGWADSNEGGIEEWLVSHGHHKQGPKFLEGETPDAHMARVVAWESESPSTRRVTADKSQMWRVPAPILGEYCILDCLSTLQLVDEVHWPVLERFPELEEWHRSYIPAVDRLLWEQTASGIRVDLAQLQKHSDYLVRAQAVASRLLRESSVGARIQKYEDEQREAARVELRTKEPARHKKFDLGTEPVRCRKSDGAVTVSWTKWAAKRDAGPVQSKNWESWARRLAAVDTDTAHEFNLGSDQQLAWLLYGTDAEPGPVQWAGTDKVRTKRRGQRIAEVPVYEINGVNGWVELDGTDSGNLPVSGDLLTQLPKDVGRPLQLYADATQELGYVETYAACVRLDADGIPRIHPGWKSPGTKTGRLAGGGGHKVRYESPTTGKQKTASINLQQMPKTKQFMSALVADEGWEWVEGDWSALEPHVLAEISQDPALLKLYGPGAKKHDVYLYSGTGYAVVGAEVRKHYDVENPDVATAKKQLKELREAVLKKTYLTKVYGGGAGKVHSNIRLAGYKLTFDESKQISDSHDAMYARSGRDFHDILEREWRARGGWVLSGLGHPIGCDEKKKKDLINRVVQKTGHDIHTMLVVHVARELDRLGIAYRGIVWDFHDQLIIQVPKGVGAFVCHVIRDMVVELNQMLGTTVPLKMEPKICFDMDAAKEAEFDWFIQYPEVPSV